MEVLYNLWVYSRIDKWANDRKSKAGYQGLLQKNETHSCALDRGNDKRTEKS